MISYFLFTVVIFLLELPYYSIAESAELNPAKSWDNLYNIWFIISLFIWLLVTISLIYLSIKYRRKNQKDGAYITHNTLLEIAWIGIPLVIVVFLSIKSWAVYNKYRAVPKDAYELKVEAFQWGWNVTYPEGIKITNELMVPVDTPIKISLTSKDVLHAFYIPEFRVQEETIPGRITFFWFRPTKSGEYRAYCSEFCGTGHSMMLAKVVVMNKDDFKAWVVKQKEMVTTVLPEQKGAKLVKDLGCLACHSVTGEKLIGPSFKGLFGTERIFTDGKKTVANEAYLRESILNPNAKVVQGYPAVMPTIKMSEEDLNAIIANLKTLR